MIPNTLHNEKILIIDFGSQYTQNIARKVRESKVYCEIHPCTWTIDEIIKFRPVGIILSGGPASVLDDDSPKCDRQLFDLKIPILGICYGMQLITHSLGGTVDPATKREYGKAELMFREFSHLDRKKPSRLLMNIPTASAFPQVRPREDLEQPLV